MMNQFLIKLVYQNCVVRDSLIHGVAHWRTVLQNGLYLASKTEGADPKVIQYFALCHDMARTSDDIDMTHGPMAAEWLSANSEVLSDLNPVQVDQLIVAIAGHSDGQITDCPTIGCCWDADRIDLRRCGTKPISQYLSTKEGKRIADTNDYSDIDMYYASIDWIS